MTSGAKSDALWKPDPIPELKLEPKPPLLYGADELFETTVVMVVVVVPWSVYCGVIGAGLLGIELGEEFELESFTLARAVVTEKKVPVRRRSAVRCTRAQARSWRAVFIERGLIDRPAAESVGHCLLCAKMRRRCSGCCVPRPLSDCTKRASCNVITVFGAANRGSEEARKPNG